MDIEAKTAEDGTEYHEILIVLNNDVQQDGTISVRGIKADEEKAGGVFLDLYDYKPLTQDIVASLHPVIAVMVAHAMTKMAKFCAPDMVDRLAVPAARQN